MTVKIRRIVIAECGTCERWNPGVGLHAGSPHIGRCGNYYSSMHGTSTEFDSGCEKWCSNEEKIDERINKKGEEVSSFDDNNSSGRIES